MGCSFWRNSPPSQSLRGPLHFVLDSLVCHLLLLSCWRVASSRQRHRRRHHLYLLEYQNRNSKCIYTTQEDAKLNGAVLTHRCVGAWWRRQGHVSAFVSGPQDSYQSLFASKADRRVLEKTKPFCQNVLRFIHLMTCSCNVILTGQSSICM